MEGMKLRAGKKVEVSGDSRVDSVERTPGKCGLQFWHIDTLNDEGHAQLGREMEFNAGRLACGFSEPSSVSGGRVVLRETMRCSPGRFWAFRALRRDRLHGVRAGHGCV